jgi:hypothetical protein
VNRVFRSKEELETWLEQTEPDWWAGLPVGKKNKYTCILCNYTIVTLDKDRGVTPMYKTCEKCGLEMRSHFYRVDSESTATHIWYRPDGEELQKLLQDERYADHYRRGGLQLRELGCHVRQA